MVQGRAFSRPNDGRADPASTKVHWRASKQGLSLSCFPVWFAGLAARLLILLIPLLVLVFPLVRCVPAIYQYVIEHPIYRLYGPLKVPDPLRYSQRRFNLKSHIALARPPRESRAG